MLFLKTNMEGNGLEGNKLKILLKGFSHKNRLIYEALRNDFEITVDTSRENIVKIDSEDISIEAFNYVFSEFPLKTEYKMISYISEETDVEELLKWFNSWVHLKCHLVAIAKNEERYIEDWCLWYFRLGFDKITIYDNNDDSKKGVLENLFRNSSKLKSFKNRIEVIPWKGKQDEAHEHYWKTHDFDWLTINDIDEFIQLNSSETNIKALLFKYNHQRILSLGCVEYGDNDIIERSEKDELKPVWEVFTRLGDNCYEFFYKSSFNKNLIKHFNRLSGHGLVEKGTYICIGCDGNRITNLMTSDINDCISTINNHKIPYIKHFRTYSLKEYCEQKLKVRHQFNGGNIRRCLLSQYYYKINQRTPEKDKFVRNWRKEHSQNYLFMCSEETFSKNHWLKECFCYVFGNPFKSIELLKSDTKFQGISSLNTVIDEMDYVVFL